MESVFSLQGALNGRENQNCQTNFLILLWNSKLIITNLHVISTSVANWDSSLTLPSRHEHFLRIKNV